MFYVLLYRSVITEKALETVATALTLEGKHRDDKRVTQLLGENYIYVGLEGATKGGGRLSEDFRSVIKPACWSGVITGYPG